MKNLRRFALICCSIGALFGCHSGDSPVSGPDLVVSSIQVPSAAQTKTSTWTLGATIKNIGTDTAGPSVVKYQLSSKSTLDSTATTIGQDNVPQLAAGASFPDTFPTPYSISQSGTWYIFVTADATNVVAESNENNNTSSAKVLISYDRIVIETYQPVESPTNFSFGADTFISLFGANGDTTIDLPDIWNSNNAGPAPGETLPYTTETSAIVEAYGNSSWAILDYTGGLAPGTYYVRVRQAQSAEGGTPYAIRFLSLNVGVVLPKYTYFSSPVPVTTDTPDSDLPQQGLPQSPAIATLGATNATNSSISDGTGAPTITGDVDWYKLTLP